MVVIAAWIGLLIAGMGVGIFISPESYRWIIKKFIDQNWHYITVAIRVVVGVLFLLAAPYSNTPVYIGVLGFFFILAGIALLFIGRRRLKQIADWFLDQSDFMLRVLACVVVVLGFSITWFV